jgi:hypothetical protein
MIRGNFIPSPSLGKRAAKEETCTRRPEDALEEAEAEEVGAHLAVPAEA